MDTRNKWIKLAQEYGVAIISSVKHAELPRVRPGMVSVLEVSLNDVVIGSGYSFWEVDNGVIEVMLINPDGTNMEPGWYDIKVVDSRLAVKSERIH